jgi:hypothetical protein
LVADQRAPPLTHPEGWSVSFHAAISRYLEADPDQFEVAMVANWIESLQRDGPDPDAVEVWNDEELYLMRVPRTDLVARCFVVVYERLIIVDQIDRP